MAMRGQDAGLGLTSGPPEHSQMLHAVLGQDADISHEASDASPAWHRDSHKTSQ